MGRRVLITGMSGVGKSTVVRELRELGYPAVDMDEPGWSVPGPDGDWLWDEDRARAFLEEPGGRARFLSGCASNQGRLYPLFDAIVLLSAPAEVLVERLATRTTNDYGKRPEELAETLGYLETVEPLLRRRATLEVDARLPLAEVLAAVLRAAGE